MNCPICNGTQVEALDYEVLRAGLPSKVPGRTQRWRIYFHVRLQAQCARCLHPFEIDQDVPLTLQNPVPIPVGQSAQAKRMAIAEIHEGWNRRTKGQRLAKEESTYLKREGWNACHEVMRRDPKKKPRMPVDLVSRILQTSEAQSVMGVLDLKSSLSFLPRSTSSDSES